MRVGIRTNEPEILERVKALAPPGWKPAPGPVVERLYSLKVGQQGRRANLRPFNLLYAGVGQLARTLDLEMALEALEADMQIYVAEMARKRIFVHAGVIGWRGRAVVIPGRSFAGKSTLVAELVKAGATYYSDEYAVLDGRGRVHPFPKALSLRKAKDTRQVKVPVEDLGGVAGVKPLPVGLVLISEYKARTRWRPRRLAPGHGMLALLSHTVPARRQPSAALSTLQQVVARAAVLKGKRGEAREIVPAILALLAAEEGTEHG